MQAALLTRRPTPNLILDRPLNEAPVSTIEKV